jgi:AbrB family looped-hinge helix DNA binding protein
MSISTITSKGQTTIPQDIRHYLSLQAGDQIEFIIEPNGYVVLVPLTSHVNELKGMLPKPKKKVSIEQMKKVIIKRGSE